MNKITGIHRIDVLTSILSIVLLGLLVLAIFVGSNSRGALAAIYSGPGHGHTVGPPMAIVLATPIATATPIVTAIPIATARVIHQYPGGGINLTDGGGSVSATIDRGVTFTSANVDTNGNIRLNGRDQIVDFKFTMTLSADSTPWYVAADAGPSRGITNANLSYPILINFSGLSGTSSCSSCVPGLGSLNFTPITLSDNPADFLDSSATSSTGTYTLVTDGNFTVPYNAPSGSYAGSITITLSETTSF